MAVETRNLKAARTRVLSWVIVLLIVVGAAMPTWAQALAGLSGGESRERSRDGSPAGFSLWQEPPSAPSVGEKSDFDGFHFTPVLEGPPSPFSRMANVGYGPLRLTSQAPFQGLRLSPPADPPSSLPRGRWEVRQHATWSRMWAQADDYLLSYETLSTVQSVAYGVSDVLRLELGALETTRFGGSLDGFVRGFHDLVGIDQGGRDTLPRGAYAFELSGEGGRVVVDENRREAAVESLFLSLHQVLTRGSESLPAVSYSLTVQASVSDSPDLSGNPIETAASVSLAKEFGDFYGYLSFGLAWYGNERFHGIELRPFGATFQVALEWNFMKDASFVIQHLWSRGALDGYGVYSRPSNEIGLGLKIEMSAGAVFEIGITENLVYFDNSPDFGVHMGLSMLF